MAYKSFNKRINDTVPDVPVAGLVVESNDESVASIFKPCTNRPVTPPELRKFRNLSHQEPGCRVVNSGYADFPLPDADFRYGKTGVRDSINGLINKSTRESPLQEFLIGQNESLYHSHKKEPLGRSYCRGHNLPEKTNDPNFRFGLTSCTSQSAKGVVFPEDAQPVGDFPAKQKNRNYDWQAAGINPVEHRFGKIDKNSLVNGVRLTLTTDVHATAVTDKRAEDHRKATAAVLGRSKNKMDTHGAIFGHPPINPDGWDARKCIVGEYTSEQQAPDADLGLPTSHLRSLRESAKNANQADSDKVFGIPSIRSDRVAPNRRSVASTMNFGDEQNARALLWPNTFAYDGVDDDQFTKERSASEIRDVFKNIGYDLNDEEFDQMVDTVYKSKNKLSINSFKAALNAVKYKI